MAQAEHRRGGAEVGSALGARWNQHLRSAVVRRRVVEAHRQLPANRFVLAGTPQATGQGGFVTELVVRLPIGRYGIGGESITRIESLPTEEEGLGIFGEAVVFEGVDAAHIRQGTATSDPLQFIGVLAVVGVTLGMGQRDRRAVQIQPVFPVHRAPRPGVLKGIVAADFPFGIQCMSAEVIAFE